MKLRESTPPYHLYQFLRRHHQGGELLLALSGGADSLSLLYSLVELKERLNLSFAILHVNHGLREESEVEEREIVNLAQKIGIPLFIKKLALNSDKNLEERAREARYAFFEEVFRERGAEGILLGHHADDQGEIFLKRMFEGSPLDRLKGMDPVSYRKDMKLFRPLLDLRKKEILSWLQELGVTPFEDRTNLSDANLRGRFRTDLIPFLSEKFGKEITSPLLQLQEEFREQAGLLNELISPYLVEEETLPIPNIHPSLQKHLIRKWLEKRETYLSHAALSSLIKSIPLKDQRRFPLNKKFLILLNGKIFFE
jgi:tRNA(Ile)-lysidine synthase